MNNYTLEFEKKLKGSKSKLIIGLLIIIVFLGIEVLYYRNMKDALDNPTEFDSVSDPEVYTCVDVQFVTDYFAEYTGGDDPNEKYSFLGSNGHYYIANLDEKNFKRLEDIYDYTYSSDEEMEAPEMVKVCGETDYISDELKNLAIDSFNKFLDENIIDDENFYDAFGMYYINTAKTPESDLLWGSIMFFIFMGAGVMFVIMYFKDKKKTSKTLELYGDKLDKIKMDIASSDTVYEKKAHLFLTKEHLINVASGLEIYDYDDIVWVYPYEFRQNGFTTQRSIYVVTKGKKAHVVANMSNNKKNNRIFNEVYETILLRVPKAMRGYTKENIDKLKEIS